MNRVYNFSAGPAVLPEEVLREASQDMFDYKGSGQSVMEMSHRSAIFQSILDETVADFRDLLGVPDNYKVVFTQGGATLAFSMMPLNFAREHKKADYIVTGQWAKKALQEANRFIDAKAIASSEDKTYTYIPDVSNLAVRDDADYVYICQNNTIYGTRYPELPNTKGKTLISDVSSMFLSEPMDVEKYGVIYGGVQKNVGPAGAAISVIREDLIPETDLADVPLYLQYKTHVDAGSLYNTPNCWAIYVCGLVFKWLKAQGGLEGIQKQNQEKAAILYDFLDNSELFSSPVEPRSRSLMNVPFVTGNKELDAEFIKEASDKGFVNLKGHRTVGGMRASIYNAMPKEGVEKLVQLMGKFELVHK